MGDDPGKFPRLPAVLSEPQFITLAAVLLALAALIFFFGRQIVPFGVALVLAFHLDGGVQRMERRGFGHTASVAAVFGAFLVVYTIVLVVPVPLIVKRSSLLAARLPQASGRVQELFANLPDLTFGLVAAEQKEEILQYLTSETQDAVDLLVQGFVNAIPAVTGWVVYFFLIPLLVFFFLKDKEPLLRAMVRCLPRNRQLVDQIWAEMVEKMGNYIRGKIWEILIVAVVTWIVLWPLGFEYPIIMGAISGISVIIPYVGAIAAAVPLFVVGYLQWGLTWDLGWAMIAYTVIQFLDGNVLVPYIFSDAVQLHPVVILLAVVLFGSLWGVWGAFFAIPLATLVQSLVTTLLTFRDRREGDSAPA